MEQTKYKEKISLFEKTAYGCGDLASNLMLALTGLITFFYTEAVGLNMGVVTAILLFSRVFDGISDFAMGFVMDKTKSKHGKARSWLLWLAVPFGISTILMFTVPAMGSIGQYVYLAITYNLATTFIYTAINIPYGALNSLMTRDQNQRASINIFRMVMAQVGSVAIQMLTLPFVKALGGSNLQSSWIIVSIVYGVIATGMFMLCFAKTKERVNAVSEKDRNVSFGKTLKLLFANKYWVLICLIWVVNALSMGIGMSIGPYYAKYILGDETLVGFLGGIMGIVGIVSMFFMMPLIKKFGKTKVAFVGSIITVIASVMQLINPISFSWLAVCNVLKGFGMAGLMSTLFAMIADVIEYGQWKTGIRVEGTLYSSTTFGAKIGAGVGAAISGLICTLAGFVSGEAIQTQSALNAISAMYLYIPIIFALLVPIIYAFYDLDKKYNAIMSDLSEREEAQAKEN